MKRKPARQFPELPKPPIQQVLELLGASDIPTGFGWTRMHCFGHDDRTPSAAVNHDLDAYKCHSCGRSGDALKLLQDELHLSFQEAVERARQLDGSEARTDSTAPRRRRASDLLGGL